MDVGRKQARGTNQSFSKRPGSNEDAKRGKMKNVGARRISRRKLVSSRFHAISILDQPSGNYRRDFTKKCVCISSSARTLGSPPFFPRCEKSVFLSSRVNVSLTVVWWKYLLSKNRKYLRSKLRPVMRVRQMADESGGISVQLAADRGQSRISLIIIAL